MTMGTEQAGGQMYRKALAVIEKLRAELAEARSGAFSPIAVVGMGCRYPGGADDPQQYWDTLVGKVDGVGEVPVDRWDADEYFDPQGGPGRTTSRWGGFLKDIDQFDPSFFQLSVREAVEMDPNQRLALEVTWQALEDAGLAGRVAGTRTGIYVGVIGNDYATTYFTDPRYLSAYAATGTAHSILSGRLAYLLDTRGPAVSIDTACSSSLIAIFEACRALQVHDCDMALAGGVNVMLSPLPSVAFSQFGMLSPTGPCRPFDAAGDGFVRSEGCGMVVLKRLADATADGDRILAVIRGGAMNQDGRSTGLTAPNVDSQRALLREALQSARLQASQVSYVEAHGTGTAIGDPIEAAALSDVYRAEEGDEWFLGSVKSNLGHMEAAAGVAGFTKVVLGLQHRTIPPNLHFEQLNPLVGSGRIPFRIPTESVPWPKRGGLRVGGVSSFGLSGTNVHLLLEEAPEPAEVAADQAGDAQLLALSAASPVALQELAGMHAQALQDNSRDLADHCWSTITGRAQLPYRAAVVGATREQLLEGLDEVRTGPQVSSVPGRVPKLGLVVADVSQWPIDEVLDPLGRCTAFSGIERGWAIQTSMVESWTRVGLEPVVVHGFGSGELLAAVLAGSIDLDTAQSLAAAARQDDPAALKEVAATVQAVAPRTRWYSRALRRRMSPYELKDPRLWSQLASAATTQTLGPWTIDKADCETLLVLGDAEAVRSSVPVLGAGAADQGRTMLESLASLFLAGARPDWLGLPSTGRHRLSVPLTPHDRTRIWTSAPSGLHGATAQPSDEPMIEPSVPESSSIRDELLAAAPEQRFELLARHLEAEVNSALGQDCIEGDWGRPLLEMGLDSLMALGVRKRLKSDLDVDLSVSSLLRDSSITSITTAVLEELERPAEETDSSVPAGFGDDLLAELENLPLDEARALLGGVEK